MNWRVRIATPDQARRLGLRLAQLVSEEPLLVVVGPYKPPKTHGQNAKLHAMLEELAYHTGESPAALKEWFKLEYGPMRTVRGREVPISFADYTREEASALIERVYQVAAEAGFILVGS